MKLKNAIEEIEKIGREVKDKFQYNISIIPGHTLGFSGQYPKIETAIAANFEVFSEDSLEVVFRCPFNLRCEELQSDNIKEIYKNYDYIFSN